MPLQLIEASEHIVLVAHKTPDADSLGAACAFYSYLLRMQKRITLFCVSKEIHPNLGFLPWFGKLTDRFPDDAECMISFDCGSYGRLGIDRDIPLINIDHHHSNDFYGTVNIVDTSAISTTEVVYDFFVANGIKINGKMALSLYAGLLDDSKCFSDSHCSAKTFDMARALIQAGADHALCVEWLFQRRSLASLRVKGVLLKEMKLLADAQFARFDISHALMEESGANIFECKKVLDDALAMRSVKVSMMILEHPQGGITISLRTDGSVNASKVMNQFGGGGHVKRAGARLKQEDSSKLVDDIMNTIIKELV